MPKVPKRFVDFASVEPAIARAHAALGDAVQSAGPLGERDRALVKLGIAVGAWREGAVHSMVRKALDAGVSPGEIRHAVLLAIPTLGFQTTQAALSWVEDLAPASAARAKGRRPAR